MATRQIPSTPVEKGWQPKPQVPNRPEPAGGYQPTTSEDKPVQPPPKKP